MLRGGHVDFIDFMNNLLEIDREFVTNLTLTRFRCNDDILDHPTVQAAGYEETGDYNRAGFLGVMNGYYGSLIDGRGPITVLVENGKIIRFQETEKNTVIKQTRM